nr:hypothetical protein [Azospirillum sp. INR13]
MKAADRFKHSLLGGEAPRKPGKAIRIGTNYCLLACSETSRKHVRIKITVEQTKTIHLDQVETYR